jgi:6-phosphogluconolactonase (cycloisomerase 2 family)
VRADQFQIAAVTLLTVIASSCGGSGTLNLTNSGPKASCKPAPQPTFAYVLNDTDATVSMYTVNSCTGSLSSMSPSTIPTGVNNGFNAEAMVVDPLGRFLYVANLGSNATDAATISMFTIDPHTGVLRPTAPAMVPTGFFPQGITVDPLGKFLYTANSDDNTVSMFTIDQSSGVLTPTTPASVAVPPVFLQNGLQASPGSVTVDPSGRFVYVSDQDDSAISIFVINSSTGVLTPTTPAGVSGGAIPYAVAVAPSGKFAYVPDDLGDQVLMYAVDASTGLLSANPAFAVPAGNQTGWVAVDPSSKFAYAVNRYDGTISMYTINSATGTLTPNTPPTVRTGSWPWPITVNASGTFAYVANQGDATVSIYSVDSNGILNSVGMVKTGNDPVAIALTR